MADQLTFFYEIYENQVTNNMFPRVSGLWQKPVPSQESEQSCIMCVNNINFAFVYMVLEFGTVLPEWIFILLFIFLFINWLIDWLTPLSAIFQLYHGNQF